LNVTNRVGAQGGVALDCPNLKRAFAAPVYTMTV